MIDGCIHTNSNLRGGIVLGKWILRIIAYTILLFILIPIITVVLSSLTNSNYVMFPPEGITLKWYVEAFQNSNYMSAIGTSVLIAAGSAILSIILALCASFAIKRYEFPGKRLLDTLFFAPITIPMIGLGIGLLFFLTSIGLVRTTVGLILSHTVIGVPYAIRALLASVGGINRDVEHSAAILGANPFSVLTKVTLPMILPGLMAGWMFSFLISFNNVNISIFIAGPYTETLPLALYQLTENSLSPVVASLSSLAIFLVAILVIILEKRFGIYSMLGKGN